MEIAKNSPLIFNIIPDPESTVICEFLLKKSKDAIKVNIDLIIYFKNSTHRHITDVIASGTQSVFTDKEDRTHIFRLKTPKFKDRISSFVYISIDDFRKIDIENIVIEDAAKYDLSIRQKEEEIANRIKSFKDKIEKIKNGEVPDVVCEGLMAGHSGLAKAMRNIAFGLDKICNVRSIILDADSIGFINTEKGRRINQIRTNHSDANNNLPCFWITMNNAMGIRKYDYCYSIGYVMFETETFPPIYASHLSTMDEIWTPSTFCKNAIIKSGIKKVFVMPLGVDTDYYNPEKVTPMQKYDISQKDISQKYKFLSVMGYSERKGVSVLIRSFAEEFSRNNDVILYIKGGWYDANRARIEIDDMIKNIPSPPDIYLDFNVYPDNEMIKIFKMCDAFVLPSRGEGFGLPYAEAMSMGLPTIGTRYGGQLEFMNDNNSYLVDIDGTEAEPRCDWICSEYVGGKFAIPNKDHLKELMRYIYENQEHAKLKGKVAREYMIKNFDWKVSCQRMYDRLRTIAQEYT